MGSFDIEHILQRGGNTATNTSPPSLLQTANFKPRTLSYYSANIAGNSVCQTQCLNKSTLIGTGGDRKYSSESEESDTTVRHGLGQKRKFCHVLLQPPQIYYGPASAVYGVSNRGGVLENKRKTSRSVFAPAQIGIMEDIYHGEKKTYLTADYRKDIAKKTGLSETQVKRWWQNRRQKDKNRVRDSLQTLNHYLPSMMFCEKPRSLHQPGVHTLNDSVSHLSATHFLLPEPQHHRLIARTS